VHLTPIGTRIVARARALLAEADAIRRLAREGAAPLSQPITLGVIPTLGPTLLPWLAAAASRDHPALRLVIREDLTDSLLGELAAHRLDAAILALPVAGFASAPLFDEPFLFAAPPGHPAAARKVVDPDDLATEPLLLLTDGHCLREQALAVCGLSRPAAGADFRATSLETLRQLVAAGLGCTLLPAMTVAAAPPSNMVIRPLLGGAHRRIGLVWRQGYDRAEDMRLLADLIRSAAPGTVTPIPPPVDGS
jgi:LysR family transcriptional regulator, hydrogen peroxide-inducible genes activator